MGFKMAMLIPKLGINLALKNKCKKPNRSPTISIDSKLFETIGLIAGLILEKRACVHYNEKKTRKSSERAQLQIFAPHLSKFSAYNTTPPSSCGFGGFSGVWSRYLIFPMY